MQLRSGRIINIEINNNKVNPNPYASIDNKKMKLEQIIKSKKFERGIIIKKYNNKENSKFQVSSKTPINKNLIVPVPSRTYMDIVPHEKYYDQDLSLLESPLIKAICRHEAIELTKYYTDLNNLLTMSSCSTDEERIITYLRKTTYLNFLYNLMIDNMSEFADTDEPEKYKNLVNMMIIQGKKLSKEMYEFEENIKNKYILDKGIVSALKKLKKSFGNLEKIIKI